jgi:nitrate reductase assembly molybdenum cofactor insertion protein NarJ
MSTTAGLDHYPRLATVFRYPDRILEHVLDSLENKIISTYPAGRSSFDRFRAGILSLDQRKREEYFVKTFEVEAVCCMDVGYVLFGEDYKRGAFLAMMKQEQDRTGNATGTELADHLPNILTLLPRLPERELADEMAWCLVVPAVKEMLKKFENGDNLYQHAFQLLLTILDQDFCNPALEQFSVRKEEPGDCNKAVYACGSDFLNDMGKNKFL